MNQLAKVLKFIFLICWTIAYLTDGRITLDLAEKSSVSNGESLEKMINDAGGNLDNDDSFKNYIHLFKKPVKGTYSEDNGNDNLPKIYANTTELECGGENTVVKMNDIDGDKRSSVLFSCQEDVLLQDITKIIYKKEVVPFDWINVHNFGLMIGYNGETKEGQKGKAKISGTVAPFSTCSSEESSKEEVNSICEFFKDNIPEKLTFNQTIRKDSLRLKIKPPAGTFAIDVNKEGIQFHIIVFYINYKLGKSWISGDCFIETDNGVKARGTISATGRSKPVLKFGLFFKLSNVLNNSYISVGTGTRGHLFLNEETDGVLSTVFESGVLIGKGNTSLQLDSDVKLVVQPNNNGQLFARESGKKKIIDVLNLFGESRDDADLQDAIFEKGYTIMVCNRPNGCKFPDVDQLMTSKIRISGPLTKSGKTEEYTIVI